MGYGPQHVDVVPNNKSHNGDGGFGSGNPHLKFPQRDKLLDNSDCSMGGASTGWVDVCSEDTDVTSNMEQETGNICPNAIVLVDENVANPFDDHS